MNKHEAIIAMMEGKKVTHPCFTNNKFLFMKGDFRIYTEDGCYASEEGFWKNKQGEDWQKDWEIYKN